MRIGVPRGDGSGHAATMTTFSGLYPHPVRCGYCPRGPAEPSRLHSALCTMPRFIVGFNITVLHAASPCRFRPAVRRPSVCISGRTGGFAIASSRYIESQVSTTARKFLVCSHRPPPPSGGATRHPTATGRCSLRCPDDPPPLRANRSVHAPPGLPRHRPGKRRSPCRRPSPPSRSAGSLHNGWGAQRRPRHEATQVSP